MKTLLLMRHAKSSWKVPDQPDHDRPLNRRGEKAAALMGAHLRSLGLVPNHILVSGAVRARRTVELLCESLGYRGEIQELESLYAASVSMYRAAIAAAPNPHPRLLIIGHNPELEYAIKEYSGEMPRMPTAAVAAIEINAPDWAAAARTAGRLAGVWQPRTLA